MEQSWGEGVLWATQQGLNSAGSKEHLDWLKINLNVWNNYCSRLYTHNKLMWMVVHIHSVKAKSQAGNVQVKDIMTIQKGQSGKKIRDLKKLRILLENSAEGLESRRECCWSYVSVRIHPKSYYIFHVKVVATWLSGSWKGAVAA